LQKHGHPSWSTQQAQAESNELDATINEFPGMMEEVVDFI